MTIVGAGVIAGLQLVTLLVMAVLVALEDVGTGALLVPVWIATDSAPHIPLLAIDVIGIVEDADTMALLVAACWIPTAVAVSIVGTIANEGAIVTNGGGAMFIGC